jgi:glycosyltransferase involved in cell wall biosynthesis
LRVAVVCAQLEVGGQETGMFELLRRLDRRRFVPLLYAFRTGPLLRSIRRLGIPVVVGAGRSGAPTRWTGTDARAKAAFRMFLAEQFRARRIDVCLVYAWADAISAAREAGVPAIVERVDGPKLTGWVADKSSCERIVCESDAIRRLLRAQREWLRCGSVPIDVIRNGVDLARFDPGRLTVARSRRALDLRPDDFVVGTVARLAPVKNLGHLLEAGRLLLARFPTQARRVRFVIAGPDDGAGAALKRLARDLGIARHVQFLGVRADVPDVLRAFDVFALTSIQEGVPFALIEAMAMALPVVATQSDSIAEVVHDNGFLVGPLDPYRTAMALGNLLRHDGLCQTLGRRSRQLALRHDVNAMVRQYERVLRTAFASSRRRPPFRRRIVVMPGHARADADGTERMIDRLFRDLRANGVDAYELGVTARAQDIAARWPPPRTQSFGRTLDGWTGRRTALEWIRPDVIITDCPRMVLMARRSLPAEEIVFVPNPDDPCKTGDRASQLADRILLESVQDMRECARRWPCCAWKMSHMPGWTADRARDVRALLATPRPVAPTPHLLFRCR